MYYKDTKIRKIIGNINLFPNFVTLIVETNTVTRMKDLIITAVIKVYQYDELNEADQALVKTAKDATARSYSPASNSCGLKIPGSSVPSPHSRFVYVFIPK